MRLGLEQNRYTALTSMNAQRKSWFISAAVVSVSHGKTHCAASVRFFGLFSPCLIEDLFAHKRITNGHCLQNNINLSMKIELL